MCSESKDELFDERGIEECMLRAELDAAADEHRHAAQRYQTALKLQAMGSGKSEVDELVRAALRDETKARERYVLHLKVFADFVLNGHELPEKTAELRRSLLSAQNAATD